MHHRSARTIFLTARTQVDTVGIAVVGADTVVALLVTAAHGQRVLLREAGAGDSIEPVDIAAQVDAAVAPAETYVAEILRAHHVEVMVDNIPGKRA